MKVLVIAEMKYSPLPTFHVRRRFRRMRTPFGALRNKAILKMLRRVM